MERKRFDRTFRKAAKSQPKTLEEIGRENKGPAIAGPLFWNKLSLWTRNRWQAAAIGYINSVMRLSNTPLSMFMLWCTTGPLRSTASLDS